MLLIQKVLWIPEGYSTLWIQKSAKYVLKEPIILVKQMEDYGSINLAGHRWETRNIIFQKPENVHKQMGQWILSQRKWTDCEKYADTGWILCGL